MALHPLTWYVRVSALATLRDRLWAALAVALGELNYVLRPNGPLIEFGVTEALRRTRYALASVSAPEEGSR